MSFLIPSSPPTDMPGGLDLGQTNTHAEGPVVAWMRGHGLLKFHWIAGPYGLRIVDKTDKRAGRYFSNVVAAVAGNRIDVIHHIVADDLPCYWGAPKYRSDNPDYVDIVPTGGFPTDHFNFHPDGDRWGKFRFHWGGSNTASNRLLGIDNRLALIEGVFVSQGLPPEEIETLMSFAGTAQTEGFGTLLFLGAMESAGLSGSAVGEVFGILRSGITDERKKNGVVEDYPIPRNIPIIEFRSLSHYYGSQNRMPNYRIKASSKCQVPVEFVEAGIDMTLYDNGVNPITCTVDYMCNIWGRPASFFDVDQVVSVAAEKAGNENAISPNFSSRKSGDKWASELLETFNGFARRGRYWQIGYIPESGGNYGVAGDNTVTEIDEHDFTRSPALSRSGGSKLVSSAIGTCRNGYTQTEKEFTFSARLPMRSRRQNIPKPKQIHFAHYIDPNQAKKALSLWLSYEGEDPLEGDLWIREEKAVNPDGSLLRKGDVIWLSHHEASRSMLMRIQGRENPYRAGEVKLMVKSERGTFPVPNNPSIEDIPDLTLPDVLAVQYLVAIELPFRFTGGQGISCSILAEIPGDSIKGADIWLSNDNTSYGDFPATNLNGWALFGVMTGAGLSTDNNFTADFTAPQLGELTSYNTTEQLNDNFLAFIGPSSGTGWAQNSFEIVSIGDVTANGGGNFTFGILRGRRGSLARSWSNGDHVYVIRRDLMRVIESDNFTAGATRHFKVQPSNFAQSMELSIVPELTLTLADATYDNPQINFAKPVDTEPDGAADADTTQGSAIDIEFTVTDGAENLQQVVVSVFEYADGLGTPQTNVYHLLNETLDPLVGSATRKMKFTPTVVGDYKICVWAVDERGWSGGGVSYAQKTFECVVNVISAPTSFVATPDQGGVLLSWTNTANAHLAYVEIEQLKYPDSGPQPFVPLVKVFDSKHFDVTAWLNSNYDLRLVADSGYNPDTVGWYCNYRIRSVDTFGNVSGWTTITDKVRRTRPAAPTSVVATDDGGGVVTVTWDEGLQKDASMVVVQLYYYTFPYSPVPVRTYLFGAESVSFYGIGAGTYTPKVQIVDAAGNFGEVATGSDLTIS